MDKSNLRRGKKTNCAVNLDVTIALNHTTKALTF